MGSNPTASANFLRNQNEQLAQLKEQFKDSTIEEILEAFSSERSAIYPFWRVFRGMVDQKEDMIMTSTFFLMTDVTDIETGITQESLLRKHHACEEYLVNSSGWNLFPDDFEVLETISYGPDIRVSTDRFPFRTLKILCQFSKVIDFLKGMVYKVIMVI